MLLLENNTTFSGSDIRVYVYKNVQDVINQSSTSSSGKKVNPEQKTLDDLNYGEMDQEVMRNLTSSGVIDKNNLSKVNSKYIDIVRTGSDQNALNLAKEYQLAKQQSPHNRNAKANGGGKNLYKPIIELGSVYSFTYSSFREKNAIRSLGNVSAKAYTRGQRTIAGSMNFTVFQSHELMDFLRPNSAVVLLDQLPKFNIMLVMMNEYGGASIMHIFGVEISSESQQMSVEDLALMDSVSFYAEDIATLENIGNLFDTSLSMLHPSYLASKSLSFISKDGQKMRINDIFTMKSGNNNHISNLLNSSRGLF